jgi:hypothetical protein
MNDGSWHLIDNLTANAAAYLDDHPLVSKAVGIVIAQPITPATIQLPAVPSPELLAW